MISCHDTNTLSNFTTGLPHILLFILYLFTLCNLRKKASYRFQPLCMVSSELSFLSPHPLSFLIQKLENQLMTQTEETLIHYQFMMTQILDLLQLQHQLLEALRIQIFLKMDYVGGEMNSFCKMTTLVLLLGTPLQSELNTWRMIELSQFSVQQEQQS